MLILDNRKTRQFPVAFEQPQDDGSFRTRTIKSNWNVHGQAEIDADRKAVAEGKMKDADFVEKYWAGWLDGEIQLSDGSNLPYNDDTRAQVLNVEGMRTAIVNAFLKMVGGAGK